MFCKKDVLRNFAKFTGKHLYQRLFFNKVAGLGPTTLLQKSLWDRCFPVNFAKFLRTLFSTEHLRWLLLELYAWNLSKCSKSRLPTQRTQTSLRRFQDVLKRSRRLMTKQDVVTTSEKRRFIYNVLKTSDLCRLEDVQFTTSWGRLIYDVFRMSGLRRPEDVWFTSFWDV